MIGLALSGGGSRAIAFHLGCMRALNDLGILDNVRVLSTISGGSVIGAYYAYYPDKDFKEFEEDIRKILLEGFNKKILCELLSPKNLCPVLLNSFLTRIEGRIAYLQNREPLIERYPSRTDMFCNVLNKEVFPTLKISSRTRKEIDVVIGACELRTGTAFRFGNKKSGFSRLGELVGNDVDLAFAVAASAAYPLLLPAFDRTLKFLKNDKEIRHRVALTDGGVYDNLGTQVLEPNRNPKYSLHTFPCEYIISCNAGHGLLSGNDFPISFYSRISKTFSVIHKRVQDARMNSLYQLKSSGMIKGFIMPYLGQQDGALPWKPASGLITREEVISYPTDFSPMSEAWIDKLSNRGEQLTKLLVSCYLQELC